MAHNKKDASSSSASALAVRQKHDGDKPLYLPRDTSVCEGGAGETSFTRAFTSTQDERREREGTAEGALKSDRVSDANAAKKKKRGERTPSAGNEEASRLLLGKKTLQTIWLLWRVSVCDTFRRRVLERSRASLLFCPSHLDHSLPTAAAKGLRVRVCA